MKKHSFYNNAQEYDIYDYKINSKFNIAPSGKLPFLFPVNKVKRDSPNNKIGQYDAVNQ
jgi:hypothetical protein